MPRPKNPVPTYRRHKASGRAFVVLDGKTRTFLGKYGSVESKARYAQIVADRRTDRPPSVVRAVPLVVPDGGLLVGKMVTDYMDRNLAAYSRDERGSFLDAIKVLRSTVWSDSASGFGPLALSAVRDALVANG